MRRLLHRDDVPGPGNPGLLGDANQDRPDPIGHESNRGTPQLLLHQPAVLRQRQLRLPNLQRLRERRAPPEAEGQQQAQDNRRGVQDPPEDDGRSRRGRGPGRANEIGQLDRQTAPYLGQQTK